MDKDEWGDPEIFRPERFLDESGIQVVGRDRIMPFSLGLLHHLKITWHLATLNAIRLIIVY